jgi:hypothetical protein
VSIQTQVRMQILVVVFLAMLLTPLAAHATTLARLSLTQLAASADAVARVRFASAESRWENGSIWTVTTFDVVESMKGGLSPQVSVRVPGGRVGHLTATVDGTPKFNSGDDVVMFLERSPAGSFSVAGWVEGTFRIAVDPRTHRENVTQDSSSFAVFDAETRTFQTDGIRRMPMEQFHARVVAAIAAGTARAERKAR